MSEDKSNFLKTRPQSHCLMCGKCCKVSTTPILHQELKRLADEGDEGAIDFLEIFEPYPSIEDAKNVDEKTVENILERIQTDDIHTKNNVTFYKCKHILADNSCGIYESRKELCDRFPASPWAIVPPGCGFEAWLEEKREEKKQEIIKQKENLIYVETLLTQAKTPQQREKIESTRENIKRTISLYEKYGANDW